MIDLPRSPFYYRSMVRASKLVDVELIALMEDIQDELFCYGYRRVTHELLRRGHLIDTKQVAHVMRANGLGIKPRKRYVRKTDPGSPWTTWFAISLLHWVSPGEATWVSSRGTG
ncbi:IS3 family transposase [Mesorhizobium retamae]|uniref:IS3 family transposase n=1 Tax=Mesorhizobium retamae TaxID=2912854 RepID=A0ABS9QD74_9HYPH|nr:IS3 family transposase [Mesorhizobium sp. IRAMC:0171]MCG7505369.1 IS3 family transposase [Mesorhizobium sp. IRAMC:0171]